MLVKDNTAECGI